MKTLFTKIILGLVLVLGGIKVNAQTTYTWATPGAGGAWSTNTNWSPVGVPGATDNVIINQSASIAITAVPVGITLGSISSTPTATSTLTLQGVSAGTLNVNTVNITGTASITATIAVGTTFALVINIPTSGSFNMNTGSAVTSVTSIII